MSNILDKKIKKKIILLCISKTFSKFFFVTHPFFTQTRKSQEIIKHERTYGI